MGTYKVQWRTGWLGIDGAGKFELKRFKSTSSDYLIPARLLAPAGAIRRTIIRHLILLLDLSSSMMDRDMRPTRFDLTLQYTREFVTEWFDQNPLGQIGVVGMRAGIGERIGEMSGQRRQFDHLSSWKTEDNIQAIHRIYLGP